MFSVKLPNAQPIVIIWIKASVLEKESSIQRHEGPVFSRFLKRAGGDETVHPSEVSWTSPIFNRAETGNLRGPFSKARSSAARYARLGNLLNRNCELIELHRPGLGIEPVDGVEVTFHAIDDDAGKWLKVFGRDDDAGVRRADSQVETIMGNDGFCSPWRDISDLRKSRHVTRARSFEQVLKDTK